MKSALRSTLQDHQKKAFIFYGVVVILIIAIGVYGYLYYQDSQEQKISLAINTIAAKQDEANRVSLSEKDSELITNELKVVADEYYSLYEKYPKSMGGLRALFLSAGINFNIKESQTAEAQYQLLFDIDKQHFLAADTLYRLIIIKENNEQYAEALKLVDEFLLLYPTHYLRGEILLTQARNYYFSKDTGKAKKSFEEIIANEELATVHSAAEEWLDLMELDATLKD